MLNCPGREAAAVTALGRQRFVQVEWSSQLATVTRGGAKAAPPRWLAQPGRGPKLRIPSKIVPGSCAFHVLPASIATQSDARVFALHQCWGGGAGELLVLLASADDLESTNEDLQSRLDEISDIIGDNDDNDDTDEDT